MGTKKTSGDAIALLRPPWKRNSDARGLHSVKYLLHAAAFTGITLCLMQADAEVIFDGSIGAPGTLTGPDYIIDEAHGRVINNNLFHSFDSFSIGKGESGTFTGRDSIRNIIGRVTGSRASSIDGLLSSKIKGANLYLLNPKGILFGPNASLDIDGAFHASTAESLKFSGGEVFEVRAGGQIPVLSIGDPTDFGFLGNPGTAIILEGSQLGGVDEITLSAGSIGIRSGTVIGDPETDTGPMSVGAISLFATDRINVVDAKLYTEASDKPVYPTLIQIDARQINVKNSILASHNAESNVTIDIYVNASDTVTLDGSDINARGRFKSSVAVNAGNIDIKAGTRVMQGPDTDSDPARNSNIGVRLAAENTLTLSGLRIKDSLLSSEPVAIGSGSIATATDGVVVTASNIQLLDGGKIESKSTITVKAGQELKISGRDKFNNGSQLLVRAQSHNDANAIAVESPVIKLSGWAQISARASSYSGGNIVIKANQFELSDTSAISASATGRGANISIIPLTESNIRSTTADQQARLLDSFVTTNLVSGADGGNIYINSGTVVFESSTVNAASNSGLGGEIRIEADQVINKNSQLNATGGLGFKPRAVDIGTMTSLSTELFDITALLTPPCMVNAERGHFTVASQRGLPLSPEGPLIAFDVPAGGLSRVSAAGGMHASAAAVAGFHGGRFQSTAPQAGVVSIDDSDQRMRGESLRTLAQAQQSRGEFGASVETLRHALVLAEQSSDPAEMASTLDGLGNALVATGQIDAAEQLLTRAIVLAKQADQPALAAGILNNLGNQQAAGEAFEQALAVYLESARLAQESSDEVQATRALSNAAQVALQLQRTDEAHALLERAFQRFAALAEDQTQAVIAIHLAKSYTELARVAGNKDSKKLALLRAYAALKQAIGISEQGQDALNLSYALGHLGALYQVETRYDEALYLTRRALSAAEAAQAPESIYRWHWQEGQLLWAQSRPDAAIAAFRRAVAILEDSHQETLAHYGAAALRFRHIIAPVYLQLVDSLLQRAVAAGDAQRAKALRIEARATVEQLKAAELRDYFRNACVADLQAKTQQLDSISSTAAVVYPILLPERLELLVSLPGGIEQYTVPVSSQQLTDVIQTFRLQLEQRRDVQVAARQLYDWLVKPYAAQLAGIDTLVFVPDGLLRTIPLAALHDGEQYLINKYGVAVTPGLSLIDPRPLDRTDAKPLLAGLSQSVQGFPALTHVAEELNAVQREYGGRILLDEAFTLERMQESLESRPPSIVHIASHGRFTGDPKDSFLLTYDGRLSMDQLNRFVGAARYREQPLELLVLSACETAAGDARAALGLAGVGVRAGARSALGSLWNISDEAASQLITTFYHQLKNPAVSKARALQQAQLKLLDTPRFNHPFYWSPFLLINNWL